MRDFRKLKIWKGGMDLAKSIYHVTALFPSSERFTLTAQIRRSAISIPSNIAEGSNRGEVQFKHYLQIALGSSYELETQLTLAKELGLVEGDPYNDISSALNLLQRQINALITKIKKPIANG